MRTYSPDGWVCLQFSYDDGQPTFFKIFGGWAGGYTSGDSWRLSSGFYDTEEAYYDDDMVHIPQASGSTYSIRPEGQDYLTMYNRGILKNLLGDAEKARSAGAPVNIDVVKLDLSSIDVLREQFKSFLE
ncbi:hypothetical protein LRP52_43935 [Photobacterium sp. ZSDE20]|uniref:Uncharacterized protein n=1 Tax=Photobacterium pectinilyticum TaxID=2906793 RepID=A0ABT1N8H1_9GAMM|nr:hypothetical protein [Photobacterium sp. ZSDE20]MCQ1061030.1 hypothetical protein [Photobacterium sp. ZSDE20]MDD1829122.1 hypothetical protein [Photobacterium sp. ZSDE20]